MANNSKVGNLPGKLLTFEVGSTLTTIDIGKPAVCNATNDNELSLAGTDAAFQFIIKSIDTKSNTFAVAAPGAIVNVIYSGASPTKGGSQVLEADGSGGVKIAVTPIAGDRPREILYVDTGNSKVEFII